MDNIKLHHTWTITIDKEVEETFAEVRDGQPVTVTRKVKKPTSTRMALRKPTRREIKAAQLFLAQRTSWYQTKHGLMPRSVLQTKHFNLTGGVLSEDQKNRFEKLREKSVALENDLVRALNDEDAKKKIQSELSLVRAELINLQSINEAVFSQTADKWAERDLNDWLAYHLILVEQNGKWEPYFHGDTFDDKEEHMFKLEESNDPFYTAASEKIGTYVYYMNMGLETSEQFVKMDEELAKQLKKDEAETRPETPAAPVETT